MDPNGNTQAANLKQATENSVVLLIAQDQTSNNNISQNSNSISNQNPNNTNQGSSLSSNSPSFSSNIPASFAIQMPSPKDSNSNFNPILPELKLQNSTFSSITSPEIRGFSPSADKPPKIPPSPSTQTPRTPATSSVFVKPKSRFVEPPIPAGMTMIDKTKSRLGQDPGLNTPSRASPSNRISTASTPKENKTVTAPVTPKTPLMAAIGGGEDEEEDEEEEEIYTSDKFQAKTGSSWKKLKFWKLLEWSALICITGLLVVSLTVNKLKHYKISELELWKWSVLLLVIVCGRLLTQWFMNGLVFFIERTFIVKKKVLYFVYGLRKSVQVFIWLSFVLLSWALLFDGRIKRSKDKNKILNYVTRALVSFLVGSAIWMVKTLLLKILASSFHVSTFFDRIQESLFHQYVVQMLSGPPQMAYAENIGRTKTIGQLSVRSTTQGKESDQLIDVMKLHKLKQEKVSAWTMKLLCNVISTTRLSTISNTIEDFGDDEEEVEQEGTEITCEWEAKAAANRIFRNVATSGHKYITKGDLLRFFSQEEADNVFPLFEGAVEAGKIKKSMLRNWVVKVYLERKSLAHSLDDAQTAVKELNKITSALVFVVIVIVWLLLMGIATTRLLIFISSQMLLIVFVFGNSAKTIFEGIIFVFVVHPFDVGDRCVIDGVQMIVEQMNILTTVFLRYDNQKLYFPNSVLATKCIGNIYRSPFMGDSVEFAVNVSTTVETIGALKARIKSYIESKPQHWNVNHSVVVLDIENIHKMKMALYITHTMNHQNMGEKTNRRSELVFEMKKIFEELSIEYQLMPQEVYVRYAGSATTAPITIG